MMKSFEAEATKVLLKLTARSVISPLKKCTSDVANKTLKLFLNAGVSARLSDICAYNGLIELTSCPRQLAKQ